MGILSHLFNRAKPLNKSVEQREVELLEKSRQIISQLVQLNDELALPRPVRHWIYLPSQIALDGFIKDLNDMDTYELVQAGASADKRYPFLALISRIESVKEEDIKATVGALVRRADSFGGDYDGWETEVIHKNQ